MPRPPRLVLTVSEPARRTGLQAGENVLMAIKRYQQTIDTNKSERDLAACVAEFLFVML